MHVIPTLTGLAFAKAVLSLALPTTGITLPAVHTDTRSSPIHKRNPVNTRARTETANSLSSYVHKDGPEGLGVKNGTNPMQDNGKIWIGNGGDWEMTFANRNNYPVVLVTWSASPDYAPDQGSFVQAQPPDIAIEIPARGTKVLSIKDGLAKAGFSAIYPGMGLTSNGQIANTIGEFTTGPYATIDVSREVYMRGEGIRISGMSSGCISDSQKEICAFRCITGDTCWVAGSYDLYGYKQQGCNRHITIDGLGNKVAEGGCDMGQNRSNILVEFF
ncbi:hypothetical protein EJ08DRAFT_737067 [Tothia fuscella]|uniref:Uncharacterized protein n=1 Tax=Tothia fuscella TaxID=1048955 RepID=A0A9P4NK06_9PEZI|nr:hypothetical protein EJ08DRAFT_737067 [Tothia fuscella]